MQNMNEDWLNKDEYLKIVSNLLSTETGREYLYEFYSNLSTHVEDEYVNVLFASEEDRKYNPIYQYLFNYKMLIGFERLRSVFLS